MLRESGVIFVSLYLTGIAGTPMKIETTADEYIIRLPISDFEPADLERITKQLRVRELLARLQGTPEEANQLAREVDSNWWSANKHRFSK